jgi:hypothetical protein
MRALVPPPKVMLGAGTIVAFLDQARSGADGARAPGQVAEVAETEPCEAAVNSPPPSANYYESRPDGRLRSRCLDHLREGAT